MYKRRLMILTVFQAVRDLLGVTRGALLDHHGRRDEEVERASHLSQFTSSLYGPKH